jgi:hypothetical protein
MAPNRPASSSSNVRPTPVSKELKKGIKTRRGASPRPNLTTMRTECQRCGDPVSLLFPCLGRRLCFGCLTSVTRLTNGYESLREMARADLGSAIVQLSNSDRHEEASGLCIRCLTRGGTVPGPTGELCTACSLALVAG